MVHEIMNEALSLLQRHGYQLIFAWVFLEALGLPLPAAVIILVGGAMSAMGQLKIHWTMGTAVGALLVGDMIMYFLGRVTGWAILSVICSISMNPETCIIKSATGFYRRGKTTLLFSKFLPGVNTVAAPLAGSLQMRFLQFLGLDLIGATAYVALYALLGFFFSRELAGILKGLSAAQSIVGWILGAGLLFYVAYRLRVALKNRLYRVVPKVQVDKLRERMEQNGDNILIYDVRSHGYYEKNAQRIPGSLRLEPASVEQMLSELPREKEIYLYCT